MTCIGKCHCTVLLYQGCGASHESVNLPVQYAVRMAQHLRWPALFWSRQGPMTAFTVIAAFSPLPLTSPMTMSNDLLARNVASISPDSGFIVHVKANSLVDNGRLVGTYQRPSLRLCTSSASGEQRDDRTSDARKGSIAGRGYSFFRNGQTYDSNHSVIVACAASLGTKFRNSDAVTSGSAGGYRSFAALHRVR